MTGDAVRGIAAAIVVCVALALILAECFRERERQLAAFLASPEHFAEMEQALHELEITLTTALIPVVQRIAAVMAEVVVKVEPLAESLAEAGRSVEAFGTAWDGDE